MASFVVGLFMCAEAIPQFLGLLGFLIMRGRTDASVLSSSNIDAQGTQRSIGLFVQMVVGVALMANCRRFSIGPRDDVSDAGDA